MITATCASCGRAAAVQVALRSPRGPYVLCVQCLGPDAARPAPTTDTVEIANREARAASAADVLDWLAEHADRIEGWAPPPRQPDQRGQV